MSDSDSTTAPAPGKPVKLIKPYPEFPLFAHAAGVWAKETRGRLVYFGPWEDPDGALNEIRGAKGRAARRAQAPARR
jgi:hypothetical protein